MQVTRVLVESYFALVRASLQDSIPKAVMHFLVLYVQRGLQQHLIRTLYRCAACSLVLTSVVEVCASLSAGLSQWAVGKSVAPLQSLITLMRADAQQCS